MSKRKNKMNLKNMKNPQLKGRDSKVVRLIRNSCPFITKFGHVSMERSDKGDTFAKCTMCNSHFCCAHSGRYDCKRHIESKQHKDFIKLKQFSRSIANYCVENQTKTNLDMQIVSPGHDFITSKSRSKHDDTIMQVIEHIYLLYIFIVFVIFYFYDEFLINFNA